jgi:hypothetical protein
MTATPLRASAIILPLFLSSISCASARQPPPDDSYSVCTNRVTRVTVHPPPPSEVSTTRTTSAALTLDESGRTEQLNAPPKARMMPTDVVMMDRIRSALRTDPSFRGVSLDRVRVSAIGSHVILSGFVPTLADKVSIEQRVREVRGVWSVDNEIDVIH